MLLSFLFLVPVFASILYPPSLLFSEDFAALPFLVRVFLGEFGDLVLGIFFGILFGFPLFALKKSFLSLFLSFFLSLS